MNLPPEIITIILKELDINQLLKCRLINKRFEMIIKGINVNELALTTTFKPLGAKNWYRTNKRIKNELKIKTLNQMSKIFDTSIVNLTNLTNLLITFDYPCLNKLKRFSKSLIHLELYCLIGSDNDLKMKRLECLFLDSISPSNIHINSPNLKFLATSLDSSNLSIKFPSKIESFYSYYFNNLIDKFVNLKELKVNQIDYIDTNIIEKLPKLEIIHFRARRHLGHSFVTTFFTIRHLLAQSQRLNNGLKIYFRKDLITSMEQLTKYSDHLPKPIDHLFDYRHRDEHPSLTDIVIL